MFKLLVLCLVAYATAVHYYDRPEEVRRGMMGARLDGNSFSQDHEVIEHSAEEAERVLANMPASFDSRTQWPKCRHVIGFIKDQAACGSCWAVAASETIADRFCISCGYGQLPSPANENAGSGSHANEGFMPDFDLSAEELMSCCGSCGDGCQGGYPIDAMKRCVQTGFVSGGWYGSQCGCQSYKINPTSRTMANTPACSANCDGSTFPVQASADRHYCTKAYGVRGQSAMMAEISANGPIECGFTVKKSFEDFFRDPSNAKKVYDAKNSHWWNDKTLGGHAIKIIGWGEESGEKFWLINNSWNVTWGDSGVFRYLRGTNLDGMEAQCVAATAKCNANSGAQWKKLLCKGRDY